MTLTIPTWLTIICLILIFFGTMTVIKWIIKGVKILIAAILFNIIRSKMG